jgi:hypothetical protein
MGTRAIVTSQPDVACYVCGRRLLRGEHPEVFVADGETRTVCELCTPRAVRAGWPREHEAGDHVEPLAGRRRGRGLMARLRQAAGSSAGYVEVGEREEREERAGGAYEDLLEPAAGEGGEEPAPADYPAERAIEAFNCSQYARRLGSLARSLGAPEVSVHVDEGLRLVEIIVAWELCWYRYRIDPDEVAPEVGLIEQGTELSELAPADRLGNALANEAGKLALGAGQL